MAINIWRGLSTLLILGGRQCEGLENGISNLAYIALFCVLFGVLSSIVKLLI